jgi:uncharacterized protein YndB with AHSA1/START domain
MNMAIAQARVGRGTLARLLMALVAVAVFSAAAGGASAAVSDVTAAGFAVDNEVVVGAPPSVVYAALLEDVAIWWNPKHTYSGVSANLSIDARPGGCFCERLADRGGVEHARIIALIPSSLVRMSGALGPLQSSGLAGTLTWTLAQAADGTKAKLTYSVGGFMHGGFDSIAPAVDAVLRDQLDRLKAHAESRKPR